MFGWRKVSARTNRDGKRFGFMLEVLGTGQWLTVDFGRRSWEFTRYTRNRHTGPEDNPAVLGWFFGGPERRKKRRGFGQSFAEREPRPVLSRQEIMRRNREQRIARPLLANGITPDPRFQQ